MAQAEVRDTSRRALLGLGTVLAAAAITGESLAVPGAAQALPMLQAAKAHHGKQYAKASTAARKAGAARSKLFPGYRPEAHLLRRATFGARPSDVAHLDKIGIDEWIARQLDPGSIHDPHGDAAWKLYPLAGATPAKIRAKIPTTTWEADYATAQATLARQVFSERQLYEIVVDIFANRLHVALPGEQPLVQSDYVTRVIRKHALGSFESMLLAAMRHPAMLTFLSNDQSRKQNVNENLGRELLELHTVGRTAGYTEKMVRSSAAILSGRTWAWKTGKYVYDPTAHATGRVKVLGFSHANASSKGGEAVGDKYLKYLARHPSTARGIARIIATRFVSDTPSESLIDRLAHVYLAHDTSIKATVEAVFKSSDFWDAVGTRMRRPLEDAVGTMRVLDVRMTSKKSATPMSWLYWNLDSQGHTPFGWQPPNGYPDVAAAWLGAGAMIQRWNLHRTFVYGWWDHLSYAKPNELAPISRKTTTMGWTRVVAKQLLGTVPPKHHLVAVIKGAHLTPGGHIPDNPWDTGKIVSLLLDSPYFQLR